MLHQPRSLKRSLAIGLAACAIAPAAAVAAVPIQGQGIAAGGGPSVTAQDVAPQDLTAPDNIDRVQSSTPSTPIPGQFWPTGPRTPRVVSHATPAASSDDGGVDTGVLIALSGGGALLLAGGLGLAGRKRLKTGRQRQLA